jgi:uncharacterized protein YtpQ (UPF0354 family)
MKLTEDLIVPILKGTAAASSGAAAFALPPEDAPVVRPFVADIVVMYAFNLPDRLQYISRRELALMGANESQLHAKAVDNLPAHLHEIKLNDLNGGVYGVSCGGTLEASLLLLEPVWQQLASYLPGIPLAAVPARDLLIVSGSNQPQAFSRIKQAGAIALADPSQEISKVVLWRQGQQWERCTL